MTFPSNDATESSLSIGFSWDDLPAILTDSLPLPITPDSIRVRIANTRNDFVDAYGTITIPGGTYDVLREKRTTYTETIVEAKVPLFGWQDVSGLLGQFEGIGQDTTISYEFFSNTEKEVIASITVDADDTPTSATFKDNGIISNNNETINELAIGVVPNPTAGMTHFNFNDFPNGEYQLNILGLNGSQVFNEKLVLQNNHTELIDLSALAPAPYFYLLRNNQGAVISSGKLIRQ
jgi:hypothetical protein